MVLSLDLLLAFGSTEFVQFLWLLFLMDAPRYLLAAAVTSIPYRPPRSSNDLSVCAVISCYNEEHTIAACIASLQANGVEEIVVVDDGSHDRTHQVAVASGATVIDLAERVGKPDALNIGLLSCHADLVLVADADTVFPAGSIARVVPYFDEGVAAVGFRLDVANDAYSLVTRMQAIEYAIVFTAGQQLSDALGTLPNVAGAAGIFRRHALYAVGGWDCEVAEDASLAMKLRVHGWKLRYAFDAHAATIVPQDMVSLLLQRLRWDASIATIWWFKYRAVLNPFSPRFSASNLFTSLDVLVFGMVLPLILPGYLFWLWSRIEASSLILLGAVMLVLMAIDFVILLLVRVPLRLLPYVPLYMLVQTFIMRPLRVIALLAEMCFSITHYDPYVPKGSRARLT